jgi:hypothetical protein
MPEHRGLAQVGRWEIQSEEFSHLPVHTVLLHTGKILGFGGSANDECREGKPYRAEIWDPLSRSITQVEEDLTDDLFCAGHSQLADGRILVAGGTHKYDGAFHIFGLRWLPKIPLPVFSGPKCSYIFDPEIEHWEKVDDMHAGRWYPTLVTLGDGRVLCAAGLTEKFPWAFLNKIEIFDAEYGWRILDKSRKFLFFDTVKRFLPLYPRMHLLKNGEIVYSNAYNTHYTYPFKLERFPTAILNLNKKSKKYGWRQLNSPKNMQREEGASIHLPLLPPNYDDEILLIAGGRPGGKEATRFVEVLNPDDSNLEEPPKWVDVQSLKHSRYYTYAVMLPDRTVLVVGGHGGLKGHNPGDESSCGDMRSADNMDHAVMEAELYDPKERSWSALGKMAIDRLYHASAHLLPDGRVATFGSNPNRRVEEWRIEIFSPPYLFKGERPVIEHAPKSVSYGENFEIEISQTDEIDEISLIRTGASTHCLNTDQRLVGIEFALKNENPNRLTLSLPDNPNVIPPGYYMLFILKKGVPSVAKMIRVGS